MKITGYILIAASFLAAAFLASLDPLEMNWTLYVPTLVVGIAGLLITRTAGAKLARSPEVLDRNRTYLESSLDSIIEALADMDAQKDDRTVDQYRSDIDTRLRDDLRRFADARESMVHLFGLQTYGQIMSDFAAGERYVNRIWSASADGYQDEAKAYFSRALNQFREARDQFQEAHSAATGQ